MVNKPEVAGVMGLRDEHQSVMAAASAGIRWRNGDPEAGASVQEGGGYSRPGEDLARPTCHIGAAFNNVPGLWSLVTGRLSLVAGVNWRALRLKHLPVTAVSLLRTYKPTVINRALVPPRNEEC
jgi:hypothetical protein